MPASYTVSIENTGDVLAQLIGAALEIVDANGQLQTVDGLAVVGHQPVLAPGQSFQYSSWAQIGNAPGHDARALPCVTEGCEIFHAEVAEFLLADSASLH